LFDIGIAAGELHRNRFGGGAEVENGRPAREKNLVGAKHDGARRPGKSGGAVDDNIIRISRERCDSMNYLLRCVEGFELDGERKFFDPRGGGLLRVGVGENDGTFFLAR
jgi:hypothetical protein